MRKMMTVAVAAAALAAAVPAVAQTTEGAQTTQGAETTQAAKSDAATPETAASTPAENAAASGAAASTTATASTALSVGLPVKDKTGAVIGQIAELAPGGQTATVKMGEQSFSIGAQSFVVQNGAAVINATQAELKTMIANAGSAG